MGAAAARGVAERVRGGEGVAGRGAAQPGRKVARARRSVALEIRMAGAPQSSIGELNTARGAVGAGGSRREPAGRGGTRRGRKRRRAVRWRALRASLLPAQIEFCEIESMQD